MSGIFISYRHEGGLETAKLLAISLKHNGYPVFFDQSSEKGEPFDEKSEAKIKKCTDFIVILDKDVFKRTLEGEEREYDGLRQELSFAIKCHKKIFRVELPNFEMPKELPEDIDDIRKYDHIKYPVEDDFDSFDTFYKKLIPSLKSRSPKKLFKSLLPLLFVLFVVLIIGGSWYLWNTKNGLKENENVQKLDSIIQEKEKYKNKLDSVIQKTEDPVLLLVGAGSLKGFLEKKKVPISTSKDWVYLPTSTGAALPIVSKEIDVKQNIGDYESRQYDLVLFSAIKAKDADLISDPSTREKFIQLIGHVIGVKIGSTNLEIVLKKDVYFKKYLGNDSLITPEVLAEIVKDTAVTVYTTSNNNGNRGISGTFKRYSELLKPYHVNLESIHCEEFNLNQPYSSFNYGKNPFVILQATTFAVDTNNFDAKWFTRPIYDTNKQNILQNDLYVYFVAHIDHKATEGRFYVPTQVRDFLKSIGDSLPDDQDLRVGNESRLIQEYSIYGKRIDE